MSVKRILRAVSLIAAAAATATEARAALIVFGAAQDIAGDADVSTNGTFDRAYMFTGPAPGSLTVNGVTFSRYDIASGDTQTFATATEVFGSAAAPYSGLSANYQTMLKGGFFSVGANADFTLNNLTLGDQYEVQVWVNDSRGGASTTRNQTVSGSPTLAFNVPQADGGLGQYVLGTFVADSTSQVLTFVPGTGNVAQVNGLQLRNLGPSAIPEPSSLLMAATLAGLFAVAAAQGRTRPR